MRIWSIGAVTSQRAVREPSGVLAGRARDVAECCLRTKPTIATTERRESDRRRAARSPSIEQDGGDRAEREREVGKRPRPDDARRAHGRDRPRPPRADGLEGADDQDAHGAERDPVAARLPREVEEKRRDASRRRERGGPRAARLATCSHAVTSRRRRGRESTDQSRRATSDSPTTERVAQPSRLKSSWLFGDVGPAHGHGSRAEPCARRSRATAARSRRASSRGRARRAACRRAALREPRTPRHEGSRHITRQRTSVRSTRSPSTAVSFLPASRPRAL